MWSYPSTWSKNLHAFSRLLKKKDLKEEIVTKIELYNLVKSTTLEFSKEPLPDAPRYACMDCGA